MPPLRKFEALSRRVQKNGPKKNPVENKLIAKLGANGVNPPRIQGEESAHQEEEQAKFQQNSKHDTLN